VYSLYACISKAMATANRQYSLSCRDLDRRRPSNIIHVTRPGTLQRFSPCSACSKETLTLNQTPQPRHAPRNALFRSGHLLFPGIVPNRAG